MKHLICGNSFSRALRSAAAFSLAALLAAVSSAADNEVRVKASGTAQMNTRALHKRVADEAQKQGVRKFLLKQSPDLDERLLDEALSDWGKFVSDWDEDDAEWEQFDAGQGQLVVTGTVEVDAGELNRWLEANGISRNSFTDADGNARSFTLVILEEPPPRGAMKQIGFFGTDMTGAKWFYEQYTTFQRKIRDAVNENVAGMGFDVKELAEDPTFERYRTVDGTLFGVHFDAEKDEFVVEDSLLAAVRDNIPDALVLFYRIDTLAMDPGEGRQVRATVALSVKNLDSAVTKAFGDATVAIPMGTGTGRDIAMDDLARATTAAMKKLLSAKDAAQRLNHIATSLRAAANRPKGPMRLVVNSAVFDAGTRKKTMFQLKKALVDAGLATKEGVKTTDTTLTATIAKDDIDGLDELQFVYLDEVFSGLGVELDESSFHADAANNTLRVAPAE